MTWTSRDLPSFAGRTVVVTGGNSGIGWHTAAALGRAGASVTLACRNPVAGEEAAAAMRAAGAGEVRAARLDLADLGSVKDFADAWTDPLDVLVNNAGVMTPPRYRQTADGFELQLGTNHLGHFALTGRLLPRLLEAPAPRVVTVSSIAHFRGNESVLAGNPRDGYRPERAYANSKLANLLFAFELQRQADRHGAALVSNAAHPGVSATNLVTSEQGLGSIPGVSRLAPLVLRLVLQSAAAGAEPTLHAVAEGGPASCTGPQWLRESRGPVGPARLSRYARDEVLARQLWDLSIELTGVEPTWL
ncbi:SDR family NAD(P)-dependent oxidoreductase [Nocardioides mesophilus]|uniref:SDR family NAD(P)-dependent oxidoreductase n=1 Tax=Nocardioides mesophilus TaxID=433659 RepID=A0A7G9R6W1_9ACTN|nr:SDR family NAD(P)-dependent oxidoreductase [Nocardioides mesophilus]QNN51336.1 SDR family NAD(P)-dependent oxidoreductase [Nocardioides mesophilus]